jgi:peptide chain release factor 2
MTIAFEDLRPLLEKLDERVRAARQYLDFDKITKQIHELESTAAEPDFWNDKDTARDHMQRLDRLKTQVQPWMEIESELSDAFELVELAADDPSMQTELIEQSDRIDSRIGAMETRAQLKEPEDVCNCYMHFHAGAGGTESCDWASMLLRLFSRWAERQNMSVTTIDLQDGDEAGVKSATILVKGEYAYGYLKSESGVHRLVRISPFDANKRRHTSFCSIHTWPEIDDNIEVEIKDDDLKVDTFRASGAGGQHVNKTESAVRITHLPSKIVVSCQNERSQHQNRAQALKILRARIYQSILEERRVEQQVKDGEKKDIAWGSQIRSYVFQPYQMVKDHRTGCETGNIPAVMDGQIDRFIEAYLRWNAGITDEP